MERLINFTSYTNMVDMDEPWEGVKRVIINRDIDDISTIINGNTIKTPTIKQINYDTDTDTIIFYDFNELKIMEIDKDNHIEFIENNNILNIIITSIDNNTQYPYYTYDISKENDLDFVKIKLRIDELKEIKVFEFKGKNALTTLNKIEDKLDQIREQFFTSYLNQEDDIYLYMNDTIYEITSLMVNGFTANVIDIYTEERVSIFIDYMQLTQTLYFTFTSKHILVIENQLFKAGVNIGNIDTLEPLLYTGYNFNKSLMIKFNNILEILSQSNDQDIFKFNYQLLKSLLEDIEVDCDYVNITYNLYENTILYMYKGELYSYNHNDAKEVLSNIEDSILFEEDRLSENNDIEILVEE